MNRRDLMRAMGLLGVGRLMTPNGRDVAGGEPRSAAKPGASLAVSSTHDLFEQYERRFAEARLRMPERNPAVAGDRQAIAQAAKNCLGIRDAWIPKIRAERVRELAFEGGRIELLRSSSWPGVAGAALLYSPAKASGQPMPLVILCCGHGAAGKLTPGYQRMARHLARRGTMVLCPDNLGQGERSPMGHADCVKPFACGTSVQGLIVMETLGWVAWAREQARVDPQRVAAIGNSGGGTLTVFLAGLCGQLAAVCSSGYPSTFDFVARKEKKHCHCNILPGIVGELEMWRLLASFAPRPLFLFQGALDSLIPQDLFYHIARKVRGVYRSLQADAAFEAHVLAGEHSWDEGRCRAVGNFLAPRLGLHPVAGRDDEHEPLLAEGEHCLEPWPATALTTDALAGQLTERRVDDHVRLWDVFPPPVAKDFPLEDIAYRGATLQILAQFEAFLTPPNTKR